MNSQTGVIHGRFQPPHVGHIEYLLAGMSRCEFLVIGIANPDPESTTEDHAARHRALEESNPYSYLERLLMLDAAMTEAGVDRSRFCIVPFPINFPARLRHYVPLDAEFYLTIYDAWGEKKLRTLLELGVRVEVMWRRDVSDRVTSGTQVRALIRAGGPWRPLVPSSVARLVDEGRVRMLK